MNENEKENKVYEDDDVIEFEPGLRFVRTHDYIPYSHWRVV